jgi:hypothetical protein
MRTNIGTAASLLRLAIAGFYRSRLLFEFPEVHNGLASSTKEDKHGTGTTCD